MFEIFGYFTFRIPHRNNNRSQNYSMPTDPDKIIEKVKNGDQLFE
jgi:hypothetical protein